ncbi:hypothetical protein FN846DRAFT_906406 [Sphaerosporella brunnea]|uniref:Uncharacterized protein n=1 Tax=Sphaerosporella brunnea TaxID=1250544 RepID=A0A5J5EZ49_9PEZI|nr:hypothetical protein FN846DRAFT_906406 [Sphaerosporella brunnea]
MPTGGPPLAALGNRLREHLSSQTPLKSIQGRRSAYNAVKLFAPAHHLLVCAQKSHYRHALPYIDEPTAMLRCRRLINNGCAKIVYYVPDCDEFKQYNSNDSLESELNCLFSERIELLKRTDDTPDEQPQMATAEVEDNVLIRRSQDDRADESDDNDDPANEH